MITKTCRQMKSSQLQLRTALSSWRTTAPLSAAGTWPSLMDAACTSGEAIRKKSKTEGDVPPSMSGSCAVCVDRVVYLFGGHHAHGNTNKFYMLNSRSTDKVLQWVRVECQGVPPSSKDKLGVWVYKNKLIFFGGYGYFPEGKQRGTFEFDETSFWNSGLPRGWNDHVHVLDTETFTWSQPITTGKTPSPRAAHACATVGNRGYVFGGRYRESRMNDLYYLNLDTWEWNEIITQGICPVGRSWHSLTPISSDHLFLFGGFTTDKQPLSDAWIYCISKNEWIQFEHNYSEKPRLWHTACASDEGEVIVFGGCANNLLAHSKALCPVPLTGVFSGSLSQSDFSAVMPAGRPGENRLNREGLFRQDGGVLRSVKTPVGWKGRPGTSTF
ncbi:kelch domain-containing protein 2 isoform 3-T5 [Morus bassanus]